MSWKVWKWDVRFIQGELISSHNTESAAMRKAEKEIEFLNAVKEKREDEIREVLRLMKKYKSIQYAHERSKELVEKACAKFNQEFAYLPKSRAKEIFLHLIHFVIEREY